LVTKFVCEFGYVRVWTEHFTVNFNSLTREIPKFQPVQTSNVAGIWKSSITYESVLNKPEVAIWNRHGWQENFIYLLLIHYINQRDVEKPIGYSISQYTYK